MSKKKLAPPVATTALDSINPTSFLIRTDDIESPMHEASQALEFAKQFLDLMNVANGYEVSPATLEVAAGVVLQAKRKLLEALARVRRVQDRLLVADPTERSIDDLAFLMIKRQSAEASATQARR
jgi:hypothetical protein